VASHLLPGYVQRVQRRPKSRQQLIGRPSKAITQTGTGQLSSIVTKAIKLPKLKRMRFIRQAQNNGKVSLRQNEPHWGSSRTVALW